MYRRALVCLIAIGIAHAADAPPIPLGTARACFEEAAKLCQADDGRLWGVSLCGPLMFVDPATRAIVANQADAAQALQPDQGVFTGALPESENIANTAFTWSGVRWTQLAWPLPEDADTRAALLMHEAFHRAQGSGRIPAAREADNAHLDTLEGRYLLQLEWRALSTALAAHGRAEASIAMRDALLFRARRHAYFPRAAESEVALELNEGLAEYTGIRLGLAADARITAARRALDARAGDPGFVRSFAYATGPAYGLLLDRWAPGWRDHSVTPGFGALLASALNLDPAADASRLERRAAAYDGVTLRAAETGRERQRLERVAQHRAKFIDGPILVLGFRHMKIQFNPRNLVPLPPDGTVYPTLRVTDDWGVLDANEGALLKSDWSAVSVPVPQVPGGRTLQGPGWTLSLNEGWKVVPGARPGDLALAAD